MPLIHILNTYQLHSFIAQFISKSPLKLHVQVSNLIIYRKMLWFMYDT